MYEEVFSSERSGPGTVCCHRFAGKASATCSHSILSVVTQLPSFMSLRQENKCADEKLQFKDWAQKEMHQGPKRVTNTVETLVIFLPLGYFNSLKKKILDTYYCILSSAWFSEGIHIQRDY